MNPKKLEFAYQVNKNEFYQYIGNIKKNNKVDIYSIVNTTLIKNPYTTKFPLKYFSNNYKISNKFLLFIKYSFKFYLKQFYLLSSYLIGFIIYKVYFKQKKLEKSNNTIGIDIFFLVDNIIKDNKLNENYFTGIYDIFDKYNKNYIFLPRLYGINKNPFKLIKFFKIINKDKRNFLFEFEFLSIKDFISLLFMIFVYPFKTLRLLQKELSKKDELFNNELIKDINALDFDSFTRYLYGKSISKSSNINKIYSWSEFQVVERSFNYGIRNNNDNIILIACQFYINYEIYFNSFIDDFDYDILSSPHKVLVNGKYYLLDRKKVKYEKGVSLRYKNIFEYKNISIGNNILLLGSYIQQDTKYMLGSVSTFDNVLFKNHPTVDIKKYKKLNNNITVVNNNIYELFKSTSTVIGTASGTSLEAVACGISVIIIASHDNLTANPLVEYGKGKIWDIAFSKDDVKRLYNQLTEYRKNNIEEIQNIASWYRENFFIEPTEENIVKVFELKKEKI